VASREITSRDTLRRRLLLVLFALGTNMGIRAIVDSATGERGGPVETGAVAGRGRRGLVLVVGSWSMLLGAGVRWCWRSSSSVIGQTCCWRLVRMALIGVCWMSAPWRVRLPPRCLRLTTAGRIACSAR
jgi:hypothetical protein